MNVSANAVVTATSGLAELFAAQQQAARREINVSLPVRRARLQRLTQLWRENEAALSNAAGEDFGLRGARLTKVADALVLDSLLSDLRRKLARWSRPRRLPTPLHLLPGRAFVQRQPLGVVGIISPWNYPLQLALGPVATALAAGNRVMLKPSEHTPRTAALLAELARRYFRADEFAVVTGGVDVAAVFSALPFDHLFFTGSTAVGRLVAQAAARNLTPVTLELGGKSPCIVDASCRNIEDAALKIAMGKLLNAGQTCIAPDYLLLPRGQERAFADAYQKAVTRLYPQIIDNPDYAAIINARQHARLQSLIDEARSLGARVDDVGPPAVETARTDAERRQMRPLLVFDLPPTARLLQEEIFGPILPVLPYDDLASVMAYINARPRPLSLYWFGQDTAARDRVLAETVSGGVTVNDTLMHIAHDGLPFGGVGESGIGAYHGEAGFLRFTHEKAVFVQSRWSAGSLLYPPYGKTFDRVMGLLGRWLG